MDLVQRNRTMATGNESSGGDQMSESPASRWVKAVVAFVVTFLIICNNTINLAVLWRVQDIGVRMKILLLSLSSSDICLGFLVCLPSLISGILGYWPFGDVMCQVSGTVNGVAISVSLWSLMSISIERCMAVHRPLVAHRGARLHTVTVGVSVIWLFNSLFFATPIFLEPDHLYYRYDRDVLSCSFQWKSRVYFMAAKCLYPFLSGTVLVVTSLKVHLALKKVQLARKRWISLPAPKTPDRNTTNKLEEGVADLPSSRISSAAENQKYSLMLMVGGLSWARITKTLFKRKTSDVSRNLNVANEKPFFMTRSTLRREMKAKLLLVITSVLFFTAISPYMISSMVEQFCPRLVLPHWLKFFALWALNTNSFLNVYIYSAIYSEFRLHCRALMSTLTCRGNKLSDSRFQKRDNYINKKFPESVSSPSSRGHDKSSSLVKLMDSASTVSKNAIYGDDCASENDAACRKFEAPGHDSIRGMLVPRDDAGIAFLRPMKRDVVTSDRSRSHDCVSLACSITTFSLDLVPDVEV